MYALQNQTSDYQNTVWSNFVSQTDYSDFSNL